MNFFLFFLKNIKILRPIFLAYYKTKLYLQAFLRLPYKLRINDSKIFIKSFDWKVSNFVKSGEVRGGSLYYEEEEMALFKCLIKGNETFFDVGAHIGYYSFVAAGANVKNIVSFEVVKSLASMIRKNAQHNGIAIEVIPKGVGLNGAPIKFEDSLYSAEGEAISLDVYSKTQSVLPDFLKVDVEGFEYDVLMGAQTIIRESKPIILVAIHPRFLKERGVNKNHINQFFYDNGYRVLRRVNDTLLAVHKHNEFNILHKLKESGI